MRILIAEDNDVNLLVATRLLDKLGHVSVGVPDGSRALEELGRGQYDLLILDLSMPVLDGLETAKAVRAQGLDIPMILLTAFTDADTRSRAKDAGIDLYLNKPLDKEALWQAVNEVESRLATSHDSRPELLSDSLIGETRFVDLVQVRKRFFEDLMLMRDIFAMYREDAPQRLHSLEAALADGDTAAAAKWVHSLKGISGSVGSQDLVDAGQALERACRDNDLHAARGLLPRVQQLLAGTLEEIRDILSKLPH